MEIFIGPHGMQSPRLYRRPHVALGQPDAVSCLRAAFVSSPRTIR